MTTRRDFLKTGSAAFATGIVFCNCGLLHSVQAQQLRQTLPVRVAGQRIRTIDVHSHCHFREAGALLGADAAAAQLPPVNGAEEAFIEIDRRLAAMDAQAVDMEVLSINPFWYNRERDLAGRIVKIQNEKLAELCASRPDRFAAFASLTLQAPDLAVQELETAVKKQGLKGAAIGDVVDGVEFSDPKFHPVWAKAEELGVPLFIHPQGIAELGKRLSGNGWLAIGPSSEAIRAASRAVFGRRYLNRGRRSTIQLFCGRLDLDAGRVGDGREAGRTEPRGLSFLFAAQRLDDLLGGNRYLIDPYPECVEHRGTDSGDDWQ